MPNRITIEARAAAAEIVDSAEYRARLKAQAIAGELPPQIEAMLWHYAKGKPKDFIEHSGAVAIETPDLSGLTNEELRERLRTLLEELG